jgi:hypothetical protein
MDFTRWMEEHHGSEAKLSAHAALFLVMTRYYKAEERVHVGVSRSDHASAVAAFRERKVCKPTAEMPFAIILTCS